MSFDAILGQCELFVRVRQFEVESETFRFELRSMIDLLLNEALPTIVFLDMPQPDSDLKGVDALHSQILRRDLFNVKKRCSELIECGG